MLRIMCVAMLRLMQHAEERCYVYIRLVRIYLSVHLHI